MTEAFVKPIRSVLIVDDDYPTFDELLDAELARRDNTKFDRTKGWYAHPERIKKVIGSFRTKERPMVVDIHDGSNVTSGSDVELAAHLHQSDLLVLDYQLDRTKRSDGSLAIDIVRSLARNDHFNMVVMHTSEDLLDVFQKTLIALMQPRGECLSVEQREEAIGIDITLAGLFWAMGGESDVIAKLIRKTLYVGAFAFILNQFSTLANIVFRSFASAGLTAGGGSMTSDDLLRPGKLAQTGFNAAAPLFDQISKMLGFTTFFDNFLTIVVMLFAWAIVILAFFILAVQMFVTILEFKLTALAGFVLVPFALWNRTAFLAERVLGNVVSSGIKVMVLAVIVGIGSTFFGEFTTSLNGQEPDIAQALSLALASMTLFGLGIFGPAIASGLVAGAPQLGAGAAFGTTLGAAGVAALGGMGAAAAVRTAGAGALSAVRAGTAMGSAAQASYQLGQNAAGSQTVGAGMRGMAQAAGGHFKHKASGALGLRDAANCGRDAAWNALAGNRGEAGSPPSAANQNAPAWAAAMRRRQEARHHGQTATQALRESDRGGASASPDLKDKED